VIPVRCFTCGRVIGAVWESYKKSVEEGRNPGEVMDELGVERYCCRRMLLSHVELVDALAPYQ